MKSTFCNIIISLLFPILICIVYFVFILFSVLYYENYDASQCSSVSDLNRGFENDINKLKEIKELPDPFLFNDGTRVTKQSDWAKRRNEIKGMAQHYEYGELPPVPEHLNASLTKNSLTIEIHENGTTATFNATVNIPTNNTEPYPVMIVGSLLKYPFAKHGFAVVTINLPQIAGDNNNRTGVFYSLYPNAKTGVLMAWAWSYHRVIDALLTMKQFNSKQISVTGHSRYGKAALIAGAFDDRIAITFPMSSGLSGVGNYRFFYEEHGKAEKINNAFGSFPWWYTSLFGQFVDNVHRLPFDQHSIIALVAPRGLLITEGTEDYWTNPQGTSDSYRAARIVYEYIGVQNNIGISYRKGGHTPTNDDFSAIVEFAHDYYNSGNKSFNVIPYPFDKKAIPWSAPN